MFSVSLMENDEDWGCSFRTDWTLILVIVKTQCNKLQHCLSKHNLTLSTRPIFGVQVDELLAAGVNVTIYSGQVSPTTSHLLALDVSNQRCFYHEEYENCILCILWPPYTMVKARDHEIVRPFETHPKAVQWKIKTEYCVFTGLQV